MKNVLQLFHLLVGFATLSFFVNAGELQDLGLVNPSTEPPTETQEQYLARLSQMPFIQEYNGTYYKVEQPGTGKYRPSMASEIILEDLGATTNLGGTMGALGRTPPVPMNRLYGGTKDPLNQIVQQMVEGDHFKIFVPASTNKHTVVIRDLKLIEVVEKENTGILVEGECEADDLVEEKGEEKDAY